MPKKNLATENGTSEPTKKMPTSQKKWIDTKEKTISMPKTRIQNLDATKKISIPQKKSKNLDAKKKTSRYQLKESPVFFWGGGGREISWDSQNAALKASHPLFFIPEKNEGFWHARGAIRWFLNNSEIFVHQWQI